MLLVGIASSAFFAQLAECAEPQPAQPVCLQDLAWPGWCSKVRSMPHCSCKCCVFAADILVNLLWVGVHFCCSCS